MNSFVGVLYTPPTTIHKTLHHPIQHLNAYADMLQHVLINPCLALHSQAHAYSTQLFKIASEIREGCFHSLAFS